MIAPFDNTNTREYRYRPKSKEYYMSKRSDVATITIVVAVAVSLIFGCIAVALCCLYRTKLRKARKAISSKNPKEMATHPSNNDNVKIDAGDNITEEGNMVISIQVVRNGTNNFSEDNILGHGGFGKVYRGEMDDGTKVAVKRMDSAILSQKGLAEFESEISVLTKVRHRNLVTLLGYCIEGNERLLVYNFMPQGTLSRHLFNWKDEGLKPLEWMRRLIIGLDVARGVEYLHSLAEQSFIHRDLKPSNILLGDDMRAKVGDFGLVKIATEGNGSIETRLAGTFGYLAPEYAVTGRVTTKVDVYSFGVILMELITGRKALDERQPEENWHLATWFCRDILNKKDTLRKAIDPSIGLDEETMASINTVAELAGCCCARKPVRRPDMAHAVNVISSLVEHWKPSELNSDDNVGIDLAMPLPELVQKWKNREDIASSSSSSY